MSETSTQSTDQAEDTELDLSEALHVLSTQNLPLEVGSIELGECGKVRAREKGLPVDFGFVYRGIAFDAQVTTGESAEVSLTARLGRIPFTAESPWNRHFVSRLIKRCGRLPHASIVLEGAGEVRVTAQGVPPSPRTPASVMATVTVLLLELKPHLEALQESLLQRPLESSGAA